MILGLLALSLLAAAAPGQTALVVGAGVNEPFGVDFDRAGNTYIVDMGGNRVSVLDAAGRLRVLAGTGEKGLAGDGGPASQAQFNGPHHLLVGPDGALYVADTFNNCVRKIDLATGLVTRVAGTGTKGYGGDGGPAVRADFGGIYAIAFRGGRLYACDLDNRRVRAVDLATGIVTTVAGNGSKGVPKDGEDARSQPLVDPRAIAFDAKGNLYICERGGHALRVVDASGRIRTVAGTGEAGLSGDGGPALEARLNGPKHIFVDADDSVLIADTENHAIRRYTPGDGRIARVMGTGTAGTAGLGGPALECQLNRPHGAQVHPKTKELYVSDSENHRVIRIEPAASMSPPWSIESPNGELAFILSFDPAPGRIAYAVERGAAGARSAVLRSSPLGLRLRDQAFEDGLRFVSAGPVSAIDDSYEALHGKRRAIRHRARQQAFTFANAAGAQIELVVRVADDGLAFRYRLPGDGSATLTGEATGFQVAPGATAWMQPHQPPGKYTPAYEDYFREVAAGTNAPTPSGWSFPALFKIDGGQHWLLVSEAGVDETSCGGRLASNAEGGLYRIRLPETGEGNGVGAAEPTSKLPWTLPWRVLIVGGSLPSVVESTLVEDVSPPSVVKDTSWIRPGRASWSWWSASNSPRDEAALKTFIDLAAEMGWEYSLVDANWNEMPEGT
ncbi:MAG TPA: glycoside hydrolase family 97 N-terminal domain-containing protein, partial [Vicinamibacteria bacterium]